MATYINGAKVLMLSQKGNYGTVETITGSKMASVTPTQYVAICEHDSGNSYYLFCCDEDMKVIYTSVCDSLKEANDNVQLCIGADEQIKWIPDEPIV